MSSATRLVLLCIRILHRFLATKTQDISWHETCDSIQCFLWRDYWRSRQNMVSSCLLWKLSVDVGRMAKRQNKVYAICNSENLAEPTNHLNDCYFCMVDVSHYRESKDKKSTVYPNLPSSIAPVPHCDDLPIPEPPVLESSSTASIYSEDLTDADFDTDGTSKKPHFPN